METIDVSEVITVIFFFFPAPMTGATNQVQRGGRGGGEGNVPCCISER